MRLPVLLSGLALALLLAGSVGAAPVAVPPGTVVQAPNWSVGSEWYYSDGYAMKVTSSSGKEAVFDRLDAPGQWFSRQGFLRKDEVSGTATRSSIYRTISDSAGQALSAAQPLTFQREYMSNGKLMVHASSWTVEGRETITVPAGTFDCWLIVWRTRSLRSDWTGFERWWYSPQAQNYVRMEYKYGPEPEGSRVLMRYHLGPSVAAAARVEVPKPLVSSDAPVPRAAAPVKVAALPEIAPAVPSAAVAPAVAPAPPPAAKEAVAAAPPQKAEDTRPAAMPAVIAAVPAKADEKSSPAGANPASRARAASIVGGTDGSWHAQVGSSKDAAAIRVSLQKILEDNPQTSGLPSGISAHAVANRGTFFRAWIGAYDKASGAQGLCQSLKLGRPGCTPFKNAVVEAKAD